MVSLSWCKKQIKGIELIDKKEHLSKSYLDESHDSFGAFLKNDGKWKVITGYYSCYNALYSILMKCGIKSEIHDCTIKLMDLFDFSSEDIEFMNELKKKRVDTQYYLKEVKEVCEKEVKRFIWKCELILQELTEKKINDVRKEFK